MIDSRVRDLSFITHHFIEVLNLSAIKFFYYKEKSQRKYTHRLIKIVFPKCKLLTHGKAVSVTLFIISSYSYFLTKIDTWRTFSSCCSRETETLVELLGELEKVMETLALWVFLKFTRKKYMKNVFFF